MRVSGDTGPVTIDRRSRPAARGLTLALVVSLLAGTGAWAAGASSSSVPGSLSASPSADCASNVLDRLSRRQRIGQLFMFGFGAALESSEREALTRLHIGSLTYSAIITGGRAAVRPVTRAGRALATQASTGGVGMLIAANQEGGTVQALRGTGFATIPSAVEQGTWDPARLRTRAKAWGEDLRSAGVNMDLAPVADVVPAGTESRNAPIGQLRRQFGSRPAPVSRHVTAFLGGMDAAGVVTSVKHFPGLGRVGPNTDFAARVKDTVTTRDDPYLRPFADAVAAGAPFVMVSLAIYTRIAPGRIAAFSDTIIEGILRGDMGFDGAVISDDLAAVAVASIPAGTRAVRFIDAGGDMIISTSLSAMTQMVRALRERAARDAAFTARLDASALRVLRAKEAAGLLPCGG